MIEVAAWLVTAAKLIEGGHRDSWQGRRVNRNEALLALAAIDRAALANVLAVSAEHILGDLDATVLELSLLLERMRQ